jgi:hypothetical protein
MLNFNWANHISEFWARVFIITAFFIPFIFALTMKKDYILKGATDRKRWRDLKLWVLILVIIQTLIYAYF